MSRHCINRDRIGGAGVILTVNAAVFGGLGVLGMALTPLPTTLVRDLQSPPAALAPVPTKPLSVLPGMGSGLELVRIPRGLDVHTVPFKGAKTGAVEKRVPFVKTRHVHSTSGNVGYVGRHRTEDRDDRRFGLNDRRGCGEGGGVAGRRVHRSSASSHDGDKSVRDGGRHHRRDGAVGGHRQGSHSKGSHHARGGEHGR